jgi:hypothetical protein
MVALWRVGVKASDIPDLDVLRAIEQVKTGIGATGWIVAEQFPEIPEKVILAKLRRLGRRGLIDGCGCGCRGDWELTNVGRVLLELPL